MSLLSIVIVGFALGMRHATDADHVIAVSTIVSREQRVSSAMLIGALWGIGHTVTILLIGGAIIVFDLVIPPRLGLTMEFSVAVMLVCLGILNLTGMLRWITETLSPAHWRTDSDHSHPHSHGEFIHSHPHHHEPEVHGHSEDSTPLAVTDSRFARFGLYHVLRPLVVGTVHGFAGSAAIALLVLATIPDPWWGILYLLIFGLGTIAGMMLITAANALPLAYTARRFFRLNHYFGLAAGLLSIGFGLFLMYEIGFVDGLFTGHPSWTPS